MTTQSTRTQLRASYQLTMAALAVMSASVSAEPMLHTPSFYRSSDMARYVDNYAELGIGYNNKDSYKFGEWSGLREEGAFAIVGFNWLSRNRNNDASYWRLNGSGLGLETRKFGLGLGEQGRWELSASADRLVRSELDSSRFIHSAGLGSSSVAVPTPNADPTLLVATPYKVEQGRDFYRLGLSVAVAGNWNFSVNYREDVRDGSRVMGVPFGGFTMPSNVAYEIDDHTQQFDTQLAYADSRSQLQFTYHFSRYENNLDSFGLNDPRNGTLGRVSLMPSNDYHQITLAGTHSFSRDVRLTTKLSYGFGTQDEAFLPYTRNPGVADAPLPRTSLDGELVRTMFDTALMLRPSSNTNVKLAYQYFDHDNRTPIVDRSKPYLYAVQDGAQSADNTTTAQERINAPLSWTEHKALVDGDIHLTGNTTLRALLEFSQREYELEARTETETTKAGLEARRPILDTLSGAAGYDYTRRTGSNYNRYAFIDSSYVNNTAAAQLTTYHPSLRAYMYNDFDENRLRANANWVASETINLQASVAGYQQQFEDRGCSAINTSQAATYTGLAMPDDCLGRTKADGTSANLDIQWQPEENLTAFAFLNYGIVETKQRGRQWASFGGAPTGTAAAILDSRTWDTNVAVEDHAIGTGFKWQPDEAGRWSLGGHYVFGSGKNKVSFASSLGDTNMPDSNTTTHTVQLFAKWILNRSATLRFNYMYESLETDDWAIVNPSTGEPYPASFVSSLSGGGAPNGWVGWTNQSPAKYENHVLGVSVALHSW